MHSRLYKKIGAAALIVTTAGCMQATRHSNTMVFGTNTNVGVKVGQNVNQVPEILIGYDRQEAVIMPLWANTEDDNEGNGGNLLSPCQVDDVEYGQGVHPCAFVASRQESKDSYAQDSYSVLASFGAQIEGNGAGPEAQVGLAQYFATGMAAQILALMGGASLVAVGDAATKAAEKAPETANAASTLVGESFGKNSGKLDTGELANELSEYFDPGAPLIATRVGFLTRGNFASVNLAIPAGHTPQSYGFLLSRSTANPSAQRKLAQLLINADPDITATKKIAEVLNK